MYSVLVIGTGQLGCRHIEGLTKSDNEIEIFAHDKDPGATKNCYDFFQSLDTKIDKKLITTPNFESLKNRKLDLVIVATPATNRPELVTQYLSTIDSQFWIIEKPLSQSVTKLDEFAAFTLQKNCWVNHWRRLVDMYKKVKLKIPSKTPLKVKISGQNLGIACNISHYIDLINFLTSELPEEIVTRNLSDRWHLSKRKGFYEISGKLMVKFTNGSHLEVACSPISKNYEIEVQFSTQSENSIMKIDELNGTIKYKNEALDDLKPPYQSQMSGQIFDQLMKHGSCDLTPLKTSIECHRPIIGELVRHWNSTMENNITDAIPIT